MRKEIKLGNTVREITSGIQGVATTSTKWLTGNHQFTVQSPSKDGVYVDPMSFDVQQLDYVDEGIADRVTAAVKDTGIVLGSKVKDVVSGAMGIAVREATFMNGCVYYVVTAPVAKDGTVKDDFVEYRRLEVVGDGVVSKIAKKIEETPPAVRGSGGPAIRPMKRG